MADWETRDRLPYAEVDTGCDDNTKLPRKPLWIFTKICQGVYRGKSKGVMG